MLRGLKRTLSLNHLLSGYFSASPDELADAITKPIVPEIGSTLDGEGSPLMSGERTKRGQGARRG